MKTRKPLRDLVPKIVEHYDEHEGYLDFNYRLYKILNGQVKAEVEASLREELLSQSAYLRCIKRIPSINILKKVTDKLSKVYVERPTRMTDNKTDQAIMENIANSSQIDSMFTECNKLYNAMGSFAIEPYVQGRKHKVRVLAPHQFLPFSDNPSNPAEMTVFIKILGRTTEKVGAVYDDNGRLLRNESAIERTFLALYSDTEFLIIDNSGGIRMDKMAEFGIESSNNPLKRIPYVYKSKSSLQLIPYPNQEGFDMSVLVPKLLTDLNYSAQFMSHSILWARNTDLEEQELNPDTVLILGDRTVDGGDPEIGTIDPKVDIDKNIKLVEYQLKSYLEGLGIKVDSGQNSERSASGVAKSIDEGDITAEKKVQTEIFRCVEMAFWELMFSVQQVWGRGNEVEENRQFSTKFVESFRIQYAEMKQAKSERQKLEEIQLWMDGKLMTRKQALRELKPTLTEEQIDAWIKELDEEDELNMEKALSGMMDMPGNDTKSDGTFKEGNSAAKNDPEKRLAAEEKKNG